LIYNTLLSPNLYGSGTSARYVPRQFQFLTSLDIIHYICSQLGDDLGTLYSLALSCRLYSAVGLQALYSNLVKFPSDYDDEDRFAEDAKAYTSRLKKWMSLWKSLAMSALDPTSTFHNYSSSLRVLNLRDLLSLMEEFRAIRSQPLRAEFFAGGLEQCNADTKYPNTDRLFFDYNTATDTLADIITSATRNVTTLIRQTVERPVTQDDWVSPKPGHLYQWILNLPLLESLQVFSGETFLDERVREAIQYCPNFKSLAIYHWPFVSRDVDETMADLLSSISGNGLEKLVITHGGECLREQAVLALDHCHGHSLTHLEVLEVDWYCLNALSTLTRIVNLRSCTLHAHSPSNLSEEILEGISQFLSRNTSLTRLDLYVHNIQKVLTKALPSLHLKHLAITERLETPLIPDGFWPAVASQADTLHSLTLRPQSDPRLLELTRMSPEMLTAIRSLHNLKYLTISAFAGIVVDSEVEEIVKGCNDLQELCLVSANLTDLSLKYLSTLPHINSFTSLYVLSWWTDVLASRLS
jgi:hypothetical protein